MRLGTTSFLSMVRNYRHWQSASEGGPDTWVPRRASGPLFCFGEISAQDRPMSMKLAPFPSLIASVLHRLDQVFNFHHVQVVIHHRFYGHRRESGSRFVLHPERFTENVF